jgi:hypothetical protein
MMLQRQVGDRPLHGDEVFLLVIVLHAQDFVDDVAVVGQQDQAFGILVQAPDRKDPLAVADQIDDVAIDVRFAGAGNADRLVQRDVDVLFLGADRLAVDADLVALCHLRAEHGRHAVAGHAPLLDPLVGLAARTGAGLADVLVESHRPRRSGPDPSIRATRAAAGEASGSRVRRSSASAVASTRDLRGIRARRSRGSAARPMPSAPRTPRSARGSARVGRARASSIATAQPSRNPSTSIWRRRRSAARSATAAAASAGPGRRRRIGFTATRQVRRIDRTLRGGERQETAEYAARGAGGVQAEQGHLLIESAGRRKGRAHVQLSDSGSRSRPGDCVRRRSAG